MPRNALRRAAPARRTRFRGPLQLYSSLHSTLISLVPFRSLPAPILPARAWLAADGDAPPAPRNKRSPHRWPDDGHPPRDRSPLPALPRLPLTCAAVVHLTPAAAAAHTACLLLCHAALYAPLRARPCPQVPAAPGPPPPAHPLHCARLLARLLLGETAAFGPLRRPRPPVPVACLPCHPSNAACMIAFGCVAKSPPCKPSSRVGPGRLRSKAGVSTAAASEAAAGLCSWPAVGLALVPPSARPCGTVCATTRPSQIDARAPSPSSGGREKGGKPCAWPCRQGAARQKLPAQLLASALLPAPASCAISSASCWHRAPSQG